MTGCCRRRGRRATRVAEIRRAEAADSPYQPLLETALNSIGDGNGATWGLTPTSSAS
jgi:hypothetical protein